MRLMAQDELCAGKFVFCGKIVPLTANDREARWVLERLSGFTLSDMGWDGHVWR